MLKYIFVAIFVFLLNFVFLTKSAARDNVEGHIPPTPRRHGMDARHESDHIFKHLDHLAVNNDVKDSSPEQMEFYYFKLHDYDQNNKLDGNEIAKALTHFDRKDEIVEDKEPALNDAALADMVDSVMKEEDTDNDGYIDYTEYVAAQKREVHDDNTGQEDVKDSTTLSPEH